MKPKPMILAAALAAFAVPGRAAQFSLGGNYQLTSQNPGGTNPSSNLSLTLTPSVIAADVHELGLSLGWSLSRQEVSLTGQTQETNTTNAGVFYRYNLYLNGKDAKHPVALYAGPQMGMTRVGTPQGSTNDFSAGGQFGENFMFSEKLALNVHLIQWDTVFSDPDMQLILTQSIGVKYFF